MTRDGKKKKKKGKKQVALSKEKRNSHSSYRRQELPNTVTHSVKHT